MCGVIVVGLFLINRQTDKVLSSLRSLGKPMLSIDCNARADEITSCCFDNLSAGRFLAQRLAKLGHRRLAVVFEDPGKPEKEKDDSWKEEFELD